MKFSWPVIVATTLFICACGGSSTQQENSSLVENPQDWDGDNVTNSEDDFPHDPAAAIDSDRDGHPDSWNEGASPSSKGLTLDAFPLDSACQTVAHGEGNLCNPNTTQIYQQGVSAKIVDDVFHSLNSTNNAITRWNIQSYSFLNPIRLVENSDWGNPTAFLSNNGTYLIGYENGQLVEYGELGRPTIKASVDSSVAAILYDQDSYHIVSRFDEQALHLNSFNSSWQNIKQEEYRGHTIVCNTSGNQLAWLDSTKNELVIINENSSTRKAIDIEPPSSCFISPLNDILIADHNTVALSTSAPTIIDSVFNHLSIDTIAAISWHDDAVAVIYQFNGENYLVVTSSDLQSVFIEKQLPDNVVHVQFDKGDLLTLRLGSALTTEVISIVNDKDKDGIIGWVELAFNLDDADPDIDWNVDASPLAHVVSSGEYTFNREPPPYWSDLNNLNLSKHQDILITQSDTINWRGLFVESAITFRFANQCTHPITAIATNTESVIAPFPEKSNITLPVGNGLQHLTLNFDGILDNCPLLLESIFVSTGRDFSSLGITGVQADPHRLTFLGNENTTFTTTIQPMPDSDILDPLNEYVTHTPVILDNGFVVVNSQLLSDSRSLVYDVFNNKWGEFPHNQTENNRAYRGFSYGDSYLYLAREVSPENGTPLYFWGRTNLQTGISSETGQPQPHDLQLGVNGHLYELKYINLYQYDIDTLNETQHQNLALTDYFLTANSVVSFDVDAAGNIYLLSTEGRLEKYSPEGVYLQGALIPITHYAEKLYIAADNTILVTADSLHYGQAAGYIGNIHKLDENLNLIESYNTSGRPVFSFLYGD